MLDRNQSVIQDLCFFILIFFIIIFSFSNTITAEWHFDDIPNIIENNKIHIIDLNQFLTSNIFNLQPNSEGSLYRPVAYLSFAFNWYFGADDVTGYHIVNILLHCLTAVLLYLTILHLLESPVFQTKQRSSCSKRIIAVIATLLWALNPVQTQAVTYIVQRMALLATFFFLASTLSYIIGRRTEKKNAQLLWFMIAFLCYIIALGSKENSITLPAVLFLVEWIFFSSLTKITGRHMLACFGMLVLTGIAVYLLTNGNPVNSIMGYDFRSFSLWTRLLTESRILVFYLTLLFFPAPWRLSLSHDIVLSTSLMQPPTTALAIVFLAGMVSWALWKQKSWPIASFAILFFLINHTIESTVFPLELIFEHRNYLPSLFLFLPLTVTVVDMHQSKQLLSKPVARYALSSVALLTLCTIAFATHTRNAVWQTEQSLWEDSLGKAPGQSRPYINLAHIYQKMGRMDEAFELCRQALTKDSPTPSKDQMRAYNNMGNISMDWGNFAEAVGYYRQALLAHPNEPSRYSHHKALLAAGRADEAFQELTGLISQHPDDNELKISMALVLASQHQGPKAISLLQTVLTTSTNDYERGSALLCLGSLLSLHGDFPEAEQQFRQALTISDPRLPLLGVIGNHIRQNNQAAASAQLLELEKHFPKESLIQIVRSANRQNILLPLTTVELSEFIGNAPSGSNTTIDSRSP